MNSAWQQHQQPPTSAAAHGQQKGQTASRQEVGPGGRPEVPGGPGVGQSGQALNQKTTPFQPPSGSTPGTTSSTTSLSREPDLNKAVQSSMAAAAAAVAAQAAAAHGSGVLPSSASATSATPASS